MINFINDNNMSLDYFKIFYVVAQEGNLTKASEKLFISQPAVTQTINKLENSLGEKLFIRQPRGISLTDFGQRIFNQVEHGFLSFENISKIVSNQRDLVEGQIRIGAGTNIAREFLPEPLANFLKLYPNIDFVLVDEHRKVLLDQLDKGEVDIAIAQKSNVDFKKYDYKKLLTENSVFFCSSLYTDKNLMTGQELSEQSLIIPVVSTTRTTLEHLFKSNHLSLKPKFEVSGHNIAISLAEKNLGIGFLPYYLVKDKIQSGILKEIKTDFKLPVYEYGYFVSKEYQTTAVKKFLPFLDKMAEK